MAIRRAIRGATGGPFRNATCGQNRAVIAGPTLRPSRIAVRRWMRGVTRTAVPSLVPNSVRGVVRETIVKTARECRAVSKEL